MHSVQRQKRQSEISEHRVVKKLKLLHREALGINPLSVELGIALGDELGVPRREELGRALVAASGPALGPALDPALEAVAPRLWNRPILFDYRVRIVWVDAE
jgi:hypothetical protein